MEFDIILSDNGSVVQIPDIVSLDDEFAQVDKEIFVHKASMEFAVYRIYRIFRDEYWKERFKTLNEYIDYVAERFDISAATIRNRITTYKALEWAGYSGSECIQMMMDKPQLYTQTMRSLIDVTPTTTNIKIGVPEESEPQKVIQEIVEDVAHMSLNDARKYLNENYTMEPTIAATIEGNQLVVTYTTFIPTADGGVDIQDIGRIIYTPNRTDFPEDVKSFIERMARRGNYTS